MNNKEINQKIEDLGKDTKILNSLLKKYLKTEKKTHCSNCGSSFVYARTKTNKLLCRSCGFEGDLVLIK